MMAGIVLCVITPLYYRMIVIYVAAEAALADAAFVKKAVTYFKPLAPKKATASQEPVKVVTDY